METEQNKTLQSIAVYANSVFKILLDPDDTLSLYSAKKLLRSSRFVYDNATAYLSENNAAAAIFIAVNMGILTYQYAFASWFMYFVTSISGIKKLYKVIFKNPLLGVFFFLSFYFKILEGTADEAKFNAVAASLGLPKHENFVGQTFMTAIVENVPESVAGYNVSGYRNVTKQTLKSVAGTLVSAQVEKIGAKMNEILFQAVKHTPEISDINNAAIYFSSRDIFDEAETQEYSDYIRQNINVIKKDVKRRVGKNKQRRKLELQRVVERRSATGEIVCLSECKGRVKTRMGCYCEGDCGKTFMIGKESWCYVDPKKCKRGKQLPRYNGKAYDKCDAAKITPPHCWTGARWKECSSK